MKTLYDIVPIEDGYHYLGLDAEGNYILKSKTDPLEPTLIFKYELEAQKYINKYLDPKKYKPERVTLNEKYYSNLPE